MKTAFITGANRGLGLEFVKQLDNSGYQVLAGCRKPETAVALKQVINEENIIQIDTAKPVSIKTAAITIGHRIHQLAILINNAGIGYDNDQTIATFDIDKMLNTFLINTIGPCLVAKELKSLLKSGSILVNISSLMGSITDNSSGGGYSYRSSKAALNMITRNLSIEWAGSGIIVFSMHPGWVRTDMGGPNAPLGSEESIAGMVDFMEQARSSANGKFYNYKGELLPW